MRQAGKVESRQIDLNCCPEEGRRLRRVLGGALSEGSDLRIGTSTKQPINILAICEQDHP